MTESAKTASQDGVNWQLLRQEWQVMENYSCHDNQEGLSLQDVEQFKKADPKLFNEIMDAYFSGKEKYTTKNFLLGFTYHGFNNLQKALTKLTETHRRPGGMWKSGRIVDFKPDIPPAPLSYGIFRYLDDPDKPLGRKILDQARTALEQGFRKNGIPITVRIAKTGKIPSLEVQPNSCKKPSSKKGIPNT